MSMNTKTAFLIADADAATRSVFREVILELAPGALIIEAQDGAIALQKSEKQIFDLVIMDLSLPKLDGFKLYEKLRQLDVRIQPKKILILSEQYREDTVRDTVGDTPFLQKPCTADQIRQAIEKCISIKPAVNPTVDVEKILPFLNAAIKVFEITASTKVKREALYVRKEDHLGGDISALIGVQGKEIRGSLAISFEERTFLGLASRMLGEKYDTITNEIADAAGEICNQVFGVAKTEVNQKGWELRPALPSVVTGKGHQIRHFGNGPVIAVRFSSDLGGFTLEFSLNG